LAVEPLDEASVRAADLIAMHLPMHTATRLAVALLPRLHALNPHVRLCAYGLYAAMNERVLRAHGVTDVLGGEYEEALVQVARAVAAGVATPVGPGDGGAALPRLRFRVPARGGLPGLERYAHLHLPDGTIRLAGYTEASRGCRHQCRHCPVVPVYRGHFRIVPRDIVLEDVRRQVELGARHITFGDPDFLNGPGHSIPLVRAMHGEHPDLSWDATIKIEHLVRHAAQLPELASLGCVLITSAAEAVDDHILERLEKDHTHADFVGVVGRMREVGIALHPTFVPFTPWTTVAGWARLLAQVADLGLVGNVAPIQLAIRLLIPAGSRLLEVEDVRGLVAPFDPEALAYPWRHPDPRVDAVQREAEAVARTAARTGFPRREVFSRLWALAGSHASDRDRQRVARALAHAETPVPYLSEPWFC
jgi:hypothetical protein